MLKNIFLLLLFAGGSLLLNAQDIEWEQSYGGRQAEYLFDVQPTADYGFILAGSSLSQKSGNKTEAASGDLDYWIWKMDEHGAMDWQKSFGGSGTDVLQSMKCTTDGGFILAGTSGSGKGFGKKEDSHGGNDYWIIKLNAKGAEEWQKTFGGIGQDDLLSISQTRDGGYIIGGSSASSPPASLQKRAEQFAGSGWKKENSRGNMDYWIIKIDALGNEQWQKTFGGQYADMLKALEPTADGGYILGGYSNSPQGSDKAYDNFGEGNDYWILKLDDKGDQQWQLALGGDKDDQLYAIHQTYDKGYIIGGNSNSGATNSKHSTNKNGTDFWVVKLDEKGVIDWQETYDFGKTDILTALVENEDHSFLIGGFAQSEKSKDSEGINDYIALKISEKGETLWDRTVGSEGEDILRKVIETRDGGYLMAGTSNPESPRGNPDSYRDQKTNDKSQLGGIPIAIGTGGQLAGAQKAQAAMDDTVNGAKEQANSYANEQLNSAASDIKKATGIKEDSPIKLGGDMGNVLGGNNAQGNNNGGNANSNSAGPKPGAAASRDKKTNYGNKDFWVVKLKDKDKKLKDPKSIEAFPNPAQQFTNVIVGFDFNKGTASVYDLAGRQLQSFAIDSRTVPVDLGAYPEGIYIVKISTDKGEGSLKIIKGIKN